MKFGGLMTRFYDNFAMIISKKEFIFQNNKIGNKKKWRLFDKF